MKKCVLNRNAVIVCIRIHCVIGVQLGSGYKKSLFGACANKQKIVRAKCNFPLMTMFWSENE